MEIFKEIPNMPGYFASSLGRIRRGNDKIISLHETPKGYLKVQIMMNGVRHSLSVHRVIASVFLGDITGMEVDHLDFNKKNNFVENLEIVTKKENMRRYHNSEYAIAAYNKISQSKLLPNKIIINGKEERIAHEYSQKSYLILNNLRLIRPVIFADALERTAGIPANTIGKHWLWLDGNQHGKKIPSKHLPAIAAVFGW